MEPPARAKPGSRWRILARDGERSVTAENEGIFDELVVDDWLHLEQMDSNTWWMRLADARFDIKVLSDGQAEISIELELPQSAMNNRAFMLPPGLRPDWLEYPKSFSRMVQQGLIHITPWHIMESEHVQTRLAGLAERFPSRGLFPFAYRQDNDDVACWEKGMGERVVIIHDFASAGWENEGAFDDVWSWFRAATDETISWDE